jgi:hypothetical protein
MNPLPENRKIVGVIKRGPDGELRFLEGVHGVHVEQNDDLIFVPVKGGIVAVVGALSDQDELELESLLGEFRAN